jgi:O-antigen ligase
VTTSTAARSRGGRRASGWHHLDAVSFLTAYLVLLFCIESRLVLPGLGASGNPATLLACVGFAWWVFYQAQRPVVVSVGRQPVRTALLLALGAFLASYAAAMARPIWGIEGGTANIGLVSLLGVVGVGLLAHDGISSFERFEQLIGRLVVLTGLMAAIGIAQFLANDPLIRSVQLPFLVPNSPLGGITVRSGFTRPFGTALHPIEFGAVITTVLPIAIARARARSTAQLVGWLPVAAIAGAVMLSMSRSALVCGLVALVLVSRGWSALARRVLAIGVLGVFAVVAVLVPGMLGSLAGLFTTAGEDGSVASRTGSYPMAWEFFTTAPLFGRGYSTFLPAYRIFDNQYLLLLVEVGAVGLAAVVGLVVTAVVCAAQARRRATDPAMRELAGALVASICAAAAGLAFYDGFSFPTATGVLFVVMGLAGALRRLATHGDTRYDDTHRFLGVLTRREARARS